MVFNLNEYEYKPLEYYRRQNSKIPSDVPWNSNRKL